MRCSAGASRAVTLTVSQMASRRSSPTFAIWRSTREEAGCADEVMRVRRTRRGGIDRAA
jgi:hypothetical protein